MYTSEDEITAVVSTKEGDMSKILKLIGFFLEEAIHQFKDRWLSTLPRRHLPTDISTPVYISPREIPTTAPEPNTTDYGPYIPVFVGNTRPVWYSRQIWEYTGPLSVLFYCDIF